MCINILAVLSPSKSLLFLISHLDKNKTSLAPSILWKWLIEKCRLWEVLSKLEPAEHSHIVLLSITDVGGHCGQLTKFPEPPPLDRRGNRQGE